MLENFLTIPDAPKYEINSQLICRNKRTGKILKVYYTAGNKPYYFLYLEGNKSTHRRAKTLRRIAVAAVTLDTFAPIPSLGGRYEINRRGKVRNAKTKRILKLQNGREYRLVIDGKLIWRSVSNLLWEVHGKIPERLCTRVPCIAENATQKISFPNMSACAGFLAPKVFLGFNTVNCYLNRRKPTIYGWKITYLEDKKGACYEN